MAPNFRYRYVDFGTAFVSDPRNREAAAGSASPETLYANELATDVGGTCWGPNEPLPILDHHFSREGQFPSSSAAVLHKAVLICDRFASAEGVVWLVTHKEPDFDAWCSMYLARSIIEHPEIATGFARYGLNPDGWLEADGRGKIDWFQPQLSGVNNEHRWAIQLASYASLLNARRRIATSRQRDLRSMLYAALQRGRDYLSESSGATEFFDEVRSVLMRQELNPAFDSVLEDSNLFSPERDLLDREAPKYLRDVERARQAIVYLPESEAPTPDFFAAKDAASVEVDAEELSLAATFRIPTDGIYLRDPECALFQPWARVDLENSSHRLGFEFTAIAVSHGRPDDRLNQTNYGFAIDPERAGGRHLYTVWSRLQMLEVEALRQRGEAIAQSTHGHRPALNDLLADAWGGGQKQYGTAVSTPQRGTWIGTAGERSDLRDDAVVEAVRTELENCIYRAASLVTGPEVIVQDMTASTDRSDAALRQFALNDALQIPPPAQGYLRLAQVGLRSDVPLEEARIAAQVGDVLWQVLYPESPGAIPPDFAQRHLLVTAETAGVWGDRGIAFAWKRSLDTEEPVMASAFSAIVSLLRDTDRLARSGPLDPADLKSAQSAVELGEELTLRAAEVRHTLSLPGNELLRRFYDAIGVEAMLTAARDVLQNASEILRQRSQEQQTKDDAKRRDEVARLRSRLEWLEVFVVGLIAIAICNVVAANFDLGHTVQNALLLLGGPSVIAIAALLLTPWKRKKPAPGSAVGSSSWVLIGLILTCAAAWLAGLIQLWSK